jgi:hypothetical protein
LFPLFLALDNGEFIEAFDQKMGPDYLDCRTLGLCAAEKSPKISDKHVWLNVDRRYLDCSTPAVDLDAYLNVSAVLRDLEGRGWEVVKSPLQLAKSEEALTGEVPMAVLRKRDFTTHVPATLFGRLGMEFLKPRSLALLFDATAEQRDGGGYQLVNFVGESKMWR